MIATAVTSCGHVDVGRALVEVGREVGGRVHAALVYLGLRKRLAGGGEPRCALRRTRAGPACRRGAALSPHKMAIGSTLLPRGTPAAGLALATEDAGVGALGDTIGSTPGLGLLGSADVRRNDRSAHRRLTPSNKSSRRFRGRDRVRSVSTSSAGASRRPAMPYSAGSSRRSRQIRATDPVCTPPGRDCPSVSPCRGRPCRGARRSARRVRSRAVVLGRRA